MGDLVGHRLVDVGEDEEMSYDWTPKLDGDAIAESTWAIEPYDSPSPALTGSTKDATSTSVMVSGLAFGIVYRLTNTVVTDGGRTLAQSFTLRGTNK